MPISEILKMRSILKTIHHLTILTATPISEILEMRSILETTHHLRILKVMPISRILKMRSILETTHHLRVLKVMPISRILKMRSILTISIQKILEARSILENLRSNHPQNPVLSPSPFSRTTHSTSKISIASSIPLSSSQERV